MNKKKARRQYFERVYKEYETTGRDFNKLIGRYKPDTIINSDKAYEVFKNRVIKDRKALKEREKIKKEMEEINRKYQPIYEKRIQEKEEIKRSREQVYLYNNILIGQTKVSLPPKENNNGITFTKIQRIRIKNLFENHRNLYNKLIKELINKYGINQTDISLLEGEIIQSDRGNTFNLPIDVKGFESMTSLIDSFTNQANIDNLLNIYEKDLENMKNGRLSIKGRIEGEDFKELFKDLEEDGLISDIELEMLNKLIEKTKFTTKEAIRNHFGKLTNMIESDPLTGVKIQNYYSTISRWINKFDKANYTVRR